MNEDAQLEPTYARISDAGLDALRSGTIPEDALPAVGDARWGMSLVLRVPGVASAAKEPIDALKRDASNGLTFYEPGDIHVTLRSVEGHWPVSEVRERLSEYVDLLGPIVSDHEPVAIRFSGLLLARSGVMVRGFPLTSLRPLRAALSSALGNLGQRFNSPEASTGKPRTTAHATLGIFERRPAPESTIDNTVGAFSATDFGVVEVERAELVVYSRSPGAIKVSRLAERPFCRP